MHAAELRVGHVYAFPIGTGPWYRHAVPVRVMSRAVAAIGGDEARVLPSSGSGGGSIGRARAAINRWARPDPRLPTSFDIG